MEPRGCPGEDRPPPQPGTGPHFPRNFPRQGQTALLSPWGGNGTGHASHRKLTSKERVSEEPRRVPFPGLAFWQLLVPSTAYLSPHGSGRPGVTRGATFLVVPMIPEATWSEVV